MGPQSSQLSRVQHPIPQHNETLRVLIDGRKLGHGGIGVYTENLLRSFNANTRLQLSVIVSPQAKKQFPWLSAFQCIQDDCKLYSVDELIFFPKRISLHNFDVFHIPHFTLPFGVHIPTVVTVHDLIHVTHPARPYYPFVTRRLLRSVVRRAAGVVTVSDASRKEILKLCPAYADKVVTVSNGLDPTFCRDATLPKPSSRQIPAPYLLAVLSNLKPHKGVGDLIGAFHLLRKRSQAAPYLLLPRDLKLVIAGLGVEERAKLRHVIGTNGGSADIHFIGAVPKEELITLYQGALALVVSSHAEGFCLPALEAKALGTPVVSRPVLAVLEILGAEDTVCKDFSLEALADGMIAQVLRGLDGEGPPAVVARDIQARFSRERVSAELLAVYENVVKDRLAVMRT